LAHYREADQSEVTFFAHIRGRQTYPPVPAWQRGFSSCTA
jgi:hypothetical protein